MPLSVREQDRGFRAEFPAFKLVTDLDFMAVWEGPLTPICQTYIIRIVYFARRYFGRFHFTNPSVSIIVLDPSIGPDPRGTGEPPQHVYRLGCPPAFPRLCVFDPQTDEWTREKSIADVLMPMVIKWFVFHEDWVTTGIWRGGGRHPDVPESEEECPKPPLSPEGRARQVRSLNAAFHRIGRRTGAFGSYLWMAAEYGVYSPPPFLPSLSGGSAAGGPSPTILT